MAFAIHNVVRWKSLVRPSVTRFVLASVMTLLLHGCAAKGTSPSVTAASAKFVTEEQRMMACLDLRDHIVDLYADEYVQEQGLEMSRTERAAFRTGWAEELARKGTFERFQQSCFYSLTPRKYDCGMASRTTDGLTACMQLSSR
jgi:hypothetical protein